MPRIYVTGASGVIGSEFVRHLDRLGKSPVTAVSRRPCPTLAADHPGHRQVATIFDGTWLEPGDKDAVIVHCAGASDPRESFRNFAVMAREHILTQIEMIEALLGRGWRGRMVYISSGGTVYGNPLKLPIAETHPQAPISSYGLQKLIMERALAQLAEDRGFELVILRVSNPYGSMVIKPNQGVIPILIRAYLRDEEFFVMGDGSSDRDYIETRDLNRAFDRVIEYEMKAPVEIFNTGSGEKTSLNELIRLVGELTGKRLRTRHTASKSNVQSNVLDCTKAREVLGWEATVPLRQGIMELLERTHVRHDRS
jgi:UDP-glucose 4-epimerase